MKNKKLLAILAMTLALTATTMFAGCNFGGGSSSDSSTNSESSVPDDSSTTEDGSSGGGATSSDESSSTGGDASSDESTSTGGDTSSDDSVTTYTVTFDSDGGSDVAAQTVEENETATEPEAPTKENHTFGGWLLNGAAYDFSAPVTGNIELTAKWIAGYAVTFNSDGGSVVESQDVNEGQTATEPTAPTKTGYTFAGWTLDGVAYDFTAPVTGNIELKASWTANTYTLSFAGVDGVDSITATYDQALTNLPTLEEKTGYDGDWKIGVDVITNETVWNYTEDKTVTAVYTAKTYTVTFAGVDGVDSITATYNQALTNLPTLEEKTGYNSDWKIGEDVITSETVWNYTEDKTVTAVYTAKTYTVTFAGVDGVDSITATYDQTLTNLPTLPEKAGHDGDWKIGEDVITSETVWNYTEDKTVTAVYTVKSYTLSFEGTDEAIEPITVTYGQDLTNLPALAEKVGYNGEWKIDGVVVTNETVWEYTEDKTVTAVYTAKTYLVQCDPNGGTIGNADFEATYGGTYTIEAPVAPDAFASFVGWTYEGKLLASEIWDIDAENIVLKAKWTYTQSFENGIPEGFTGTLRNTQVSQSNAQASDGSNSMLLHTTSSNGYGYTVISKDYLDKVFADSNVVALAIDVYSNATFTDFAYRGFRGTSENNIPYASETVGATKDAWVTVYYGRKAYEDSAKLTGTNYLFYYAPGAAGLDLYIDNMRPVMADELAINFAEGGEISGESYQVNGETLVTFSGGTTKHMVYEGDSTDGDGKSIRYFFWRRNPGSDIILPLDMMRLGASAYSYVAFDVKVAYDVSGALYWTNNSGTGTYKDIKAGEWTTLYCPINYTSLYRGNLCLHLSSTTQRRTYPCPPTAGSRYDSHQSPIALRTSRLDNRFTDRDLAGTQSAIQT